MIGWQHRSEPYVPTWGEVFRACALMSIPWLLVLFHSLLDWWAK